MPAGRLTRLGAAPDFHHWLLRNNQDAKTYLIRDLAGASFFDIALFRDLASRHLAFANPSAFIAEQLEEVVNGNR